MTEVEIDYTRLNKGHHFSLPEWAVNMFPKTDNRTILSFDGEKPVSSDPAFVFTPDMSIVDAYDFLNGEGVTILFDKSLYQEIGGDSKDEDGNVESLSHAWLFGPADKDGSGRIMLSSPPESYFISQVEEFNTWMTEILPAYDANPDDFYNTWCFLGSHPAYWLWNGSDFSSDVTVSLSPNVYWENGKLVFSVSMGCHVGPEYKYTYGDDSITATESSYEKAVIQMAKNVREKYAVDGSDK